MSCAFLYPNKLSVLCWLQPLASGGWSRFFGRQNRTASPRERGFVGFWGGFASLSDNYPAVPARGGEMSDSYIGPSGLCAGLRKMFLRRK